MGITAAYLSHYARHDIRCGDASHVVWNESHVTLFVKIVLYLRRRHARDVEGLLTKKYDFNGTIKKREVTLGILLGIDARFNFFALFVQVVLSPGFGWFSGHLHIEDLRVIIWILNVDMQRIYHNIIWISKQITQSQITSSSNAIQIDITNI